MDREEMWEVLVDMKIATDKEIELVVEINGYSKQAFLDILYARTGLRNFDQLEMEND